LIAVKQLFFKIPRKEKLYAGYSLPGNTDGTAIPIAPDAAHSKSKIAQPAMTLI
jgi:hypothetical protein